MPTSDELQLVCKELLMSPITYLSAEDAEEMLDNIDILKAMLVLHIYRATNVE